MDILRITARWSGFNGAPGYSNFHFTTSGGFWDGGLLADGAEEAANNARIVVRNAFLEIDNILPESVGITIEPEALVLDSDTGETLGFVPVEGQGLSGGNATGGYSAATGAVVNWNTNDYRFGRRIRGRTFVVPLAGSAYEDDGTLTSSAITALRDFGDSIVNGAANPDFGVWSRPRNGSGGVFASVVGYSVPDMAAVLRSRRD